MRTREEMRHWLEVIWAMAPLNRFYKLVPRNGVYVEVDHA